MRKGLPPQNCIENSTSAAEFSAAEDLSILYSHHLAPSRQPTCPSIGTSWLTFRNFLRSFFANLQNIKMSAFGLWFASRRVVFPTRVSFINYTDWFSSGAYFE